MFRSALPVGALLFLSPADMFASHSDSVEYLGEDEVGL